LHAAGGSVKTFFSAVIADLCDHLAHDLINIGEGVGGDLAHHQHKAGFGDSFASHAGILVVCKHCIQYGIADLVAKLVRMAFGDRFGGE
jgi:hypothetical protein